MKQSPYFNINYGWPRGTDGWDTGMNENLLVLSFLDTQRVINIVPSVPASPDDGDAYIVSSDNSARFYADGVWNIVYPADGWEFTTEDNATWVFEGGIPVQRVNPSDLSSAINQIDTRVTDAEDQIGGITDSVENLSDLPDRVVELEQNSATTTQLQDVVLDVEALDQRIGVLEDSVPLVEGRLDSLRFDVGELQTTTLDISGELDAKVSTIVPGDGINVDNTDPTNPVISVDDTTFDPAGAAEGVNTTLTTLINERMSAASRDAVNALDPTTATLEDLITALQLT